MCVGRRLKRVVATLLGVEGFRISTLPVETLQWINILDKTPGYNLLLFPAWPAETYGHSVIYLACARNATCLVHVQRLRHVRGLEQLTIQECSKTNAAYLGSLRWLGGSGGLFAFLLAATHISLDDRCSKILRKDLDTRERWSKSSGWRKAMTYACIRRKQNSFWPHCSPQGICPWACPLDGPASLDVARYASLSKSRHLGRLQPASSL